MTCSMFHTFQDSITSSGNSVLHQTKARHRSMSLITSIVTLIRYSPLLTIYFNSNPISIYCRETVKNHSVVWNSEFSSEITISLGKDDILQPSELTLQVRQVNNKNEETLGEAIVNLAEFADKAVSSRKYLLQNSKVNSAIRVFLNECSSWQLIW